MPLFKRSDPDDDVLDPRVADVFGGYEPKDEQRAAKRVRKAQKALLAHLHTTEQLLAVATSGLDDHILVCTDRRTFTLNRDSPGNEVPLARAIGVSVAPVFKKTALSVLDFEAKHPQRKHDIRHVIEHSVRIELMSESEACRLKKLIQQAVHAANAGVEPKPWEREYEPGWTPSI